ncbi:MAG TPA: YafY family protein [Anaerolineae bacterium]|nr:YafY family transcriptional regulator [Anaerolineae bacterium]MCB0180294.1 YafY family transcriptional regulator [Anaerolineae bacterium]MCB0224911.1 YafY family transcriptional regulator [Anaerolineae bacterium]MCB9107645.1 YafY family transcriptional regulator [Anaerolineales bacterium]HRV94571.1 YafY family protein [Anaerolineae bacterium]
MNRVDRLMGYLLLFQSRGLMRAQDFSQQFEISERTVYRDIQALCEVGVPIVAIPGEGYRLMEGYYLPPITFTANEARSLYLAIAMLSGWAKEGSTRSTAATALEKVRAVLPSTTLKQVEALAAIIHFHTLDKTKLDFDDEKLLTLQEAIHEKRIVHIRYHALNTNAVTERDVEPIELVFFDKVWMLTAYCRLRQDRRMFRLDRIDDLQVRRETFEPRQPERYTMERSPTQIIVRFDQSVVRWVREAQHYSFIKEQAADTTNPHDRIMIYQPREFRQIKGWLLSWGDKMEILEPPEFRAELAATVAEMLSGHSPDFSSQPE